MDDKTIKLTPGNIIGGHIKTRKHRKEEKAFMQVLSSLVNNYLEFKRANNISSLIKTEYTICDKQWRHYVLKWNMNPNRVTALRPNDFAQFVNDYEKKNK